jgi:hypothetical protein
VRRKPRTTEEFEQDARVENNDPAFQRRILGRELPTYTLADLRNLERRKLGPDWGKPKR